jgi:hypothetical protein
MNDAVVVIVVAIRVWHEEEKRKRNVIKFLILYVRWRVKKKNNKNKVLEINVEFFESWQRVHSTGRIIMPTKI